MKEDFIKNICIQTFGISNDPALILIAGAAGQGILWNYSLCQKLAQAGYFVIRFDNRDTGKSFGVNYESDPYTLKDMAEDIIVILNQLEIKQAHIVGMSMGGYIAQVLAMLYPERILTLTFIMSTINSLALRGARKMTNLPGQDFQTIQRIAQIYHVPRTNMEDRIKSLTDVWSLFNGNEAPFPYEEWYELAKESYARAKSKNAVRNHRLAILNSPADRTKALKSLAIPTLVIHGEADPIIHVEHAYYIKEHLPQVRLNIIKKMGHILSSHFTNQIEDILLEHFKGAK